MKANKRIRDLRRRSNRRLVVHRLDIGTTTYPLLRADKKGKQAPAPVDVMER